MPALTRSVRGSSNQLLYHVLEEPQLMAAVRELPAPALVRLIHHVGLEDAGELIALTSTQQLGQIFDAELWQAAEPGSDESFRPERFALFLRLLYEAGETFVVERLLAMPRELLTLAIHKLLLVVDIDALTVRFASSGTWVDDSIDRVTRAIDEAQFEEWEEFRLIARDAEAFEDVWNALLALDRENHELVRYVIERCCDMDGELIEESGLYAVLNEDEMLENDIASERSERRAAAGFVSPADARAFLDLARRETIDSAPDGRDPIARAYFRELAPDEPKAAAERALPARAGAQPDVGRLLAVLREANVFDDEPELSTSAKLFTGAGGAPALSGSRQHVATSKTKAYASAKSKAEVGKSNKGEAGKSSKGEASKLGKGEVSKASKGEGSKSSKGEGSKSSKGELSKSSKGELSKSSKGEVSKSNKGEVSKSNKGEVSKSNKGGVGESRNSKSNKSEVGKSRNGEASTSELGESNKGEVSKSSKRVDRAIVAEPAAPERHESDGAQESDGRRLTLMASSLLVLRERAPVLHAQRTEELGFLANVLLAGSRHDGRTYRPVEAIECALAVCSIGMEREHTRREREHAAGARKGIEDAAPTAAEGSALLDELSADQLFRAGLYALRIALVEPARAAVAQLLDIKLTDVPAALSGGSTSLVPLIDIEGVDAIALAALAEPEPWLAGRLTAADHIFVASQTDIRSAREFLAEHTTRDEHS